MKKRKAASPDLVDNSVTRWNALADLWAHRDQWRRPVSRALLAREFSEQLQDIMPAVIAIAMVVGLLIFVALPWSVGSNYAATLAQLWPIWVMQVAPMMAAQVLALQRAPSVALELTHREASGEFHALALMGITPAAHPGVIWVIAHALVVLVASLWMVIFSALFGLLGSFVMDEGDLRFSFHSVFEFVAPLRWLSSLAFAMFLGAVGSLVALLHAWPGTQVAHGKLDIHRLGVRAMAASSLACFAAGITLGWLRRMLEL
jgi:ABC-type transporter Mla maintaining outer membrane lipid asymmetry permease subunit MlaE